MKRVLFVLCVFSLCAATARAEMRITEWMYKGAKINAAEEENEFIEFTNVGSTNVDMTGWSYDDNSQTSGTVDLSAFGIVAPGESVILAEPNEADFRTEWNLASTIKVIGSNGANLGRNDEINLYDDSDTLVDQLTFGDEDFPGSIRTQCVSGNPSNPSVLGENEVLNWVASVNGDAFGSYVSANGDVANPGTYTVPEPTSLLFVLTGLMGLLGCRRRG